MDPVIAVKIERVTRNREHGAAWLSREAIDIMRLAAERCDAAAVLDFQDKLAWVAREVVKTRPSMASITNLVSQFLYEVVRRAERERDLDSLRRFAISTADELIDGSIKAARRAAERGAALIRDGDRLITCSFSTTVCQTFTVAKEKRKQIEVIALHAASSGEATARELEVERISVQVIPDGAVSDYISEVSKALVGADSILWDGSLINGTPSYALAQAAKSAAIPFYSLCEMAKFDVRSYLGESPELEEGFDLIPPDMVTAIVTEEGMSKPGDVVKEMKRMAKYVEFLRSRL